MSLLLLLALHAHAADPCGGIGQLPAEGAVLATVDGAPVTQGMVDATFAALPASTQAQVTADPGAMAQLVEQVTLAQALYAEACRQQIQARPEVGRAIAVAERNALASSLLDAVITARLTPEREQQWYDLHAVQFHRPQVRARHILVKDQATADTLMKGLRAGDDFGKVAQASSIDSGSAADGGELGWFEKDRMVAPFADAAFGATPGQLVGPVQTQYGWHIILVEERRDEVPFEEARPRIEEALRSELVEAYLDEVKAAHPAIPAAPAQ